MHSRQALTTKPRPSAGIYLQYNCWVSCSMTIPPAPNSLWPQGHGFLGLMETIAHRLPQGAPNSLPPVEEYPKSPQKHYTQAEGAAGVGGVVLAQPGKSGFHCPSLAEPNTHLDTTPGKLWVLLFELGDELIIVHLKQARASYGGGSCP